MTEHDKILVKNSFSKIIPIADRVSEKFYNRLFDLDDSLRHLFKSDMQAQRKKFMEMIAHTISSLDDFEVLAPVLRKLGTSHIDHNVQPEHYYLIGEALLWAIGQELEDEFDYNTKLAWFTVYNEITKVMLEGTKLVGTK